MYLVLLVSSSKWPERESEESYKSRLYPADG